MIPQQLNGYRVLIATSTPKAPATRAGYVVLVDREKPPCRFVTAWTGVGDKDWGNGHYFESFSEASKDFERRSNRGY